MNMNVTIRALCVLAIAGGLMVTMGQAQSASPADLYQEALHLQEVKGDLVKAIAIYRTIAERYGNDAVAPKALLELAGCYEKLGQPDATEVYQRIVTRYGASPAAAMARTRLAAGDQKTQAVATRRVWDEGGNAVSKDGKYLTFIDSETGDLAIRDLASNKSRRLTNNVRPYWDSFAEDGLPSPDGKRIAYSWFNNVRERYELRIIDLNGGQPQVVYANDEKAAGVGVVGWLPDNGQLVISLLQTYSPRSPRSPQLMVIPTRGGAAPRTIRRFDGLDPRSFFLSHDGRYVAYDLPTVEGKLESDLFVVAVSDGAVSKIDSNLADDIVLSWTADSQHLLFCSDRGGTYGLWALKLANGRAQGEPALVQPALGRISGLGVTAKGDFYYWKSEQQDTVRIVTLDPSTGKQAGAVLDVEGRYVGGKSQAAWSPDGARLAYGQATNFGPSLAMPLTSRGDLIGKRLAIHTIATGDVRLIDLHMQNFQNPAWSPDGKAIFIQGNQGPGGSRQGLYRVDVEKGTVSVVAVKEQESDRGRAWPTVSPSGAGIYFRWAVSGIVDGPGKEPAIAFRDLATGKEQTVFAGANQQFALSPDGQWLAITQQAPGARLQVVPSSGGPAKALSPVLADWSIRGAVAWSHDGRSIFVVRNTDTDSVIWQVPTDGSAPRSTGVVWNGGLGRIDAHPDGRRLAVSVDRNITETWVMPNLMAVLK